MLWLPAAGASNDAHTALVQKVWQSTRLAALSESMVDNLVAGIEQHPQMQALSAERRERLLAHYRHHTRAERFAAALRQTLEQAGQSQLHALLALSESPVARKALNHELAFEAVPFETLVEYAAQLRKTAEGQTRLQAIRRLDKAIGVTDMAVTIAATNVYGVQIARQELAGHAPLATTNATLARMKQYAERARPVHARHVQLTYLYLYRHLSLTDLQAYVVLQENPAVTSMQRQFIRSLGEEMILIQQEVMRDVIQDMRGMGQRQA